MSKPMELGSSEPTIDKQKAAEQSTLQLQHSHSQGIITNIDVTTAYNKNLLLISQMINAIGMGPFQWRLAVSCAFGFLVDQMLLVSISLAPPQAAYEFGPKYATLISASQYAGLLLGAIVFGLLADNIGRRYVWQASLFGVSIFTMVLAGSPNWASMNIFVSLAGFFGGGNSIDLTLLAECLPVKWQFLLTGLASVWGLGNAITGLIAWPLLVNFGCASDSTPITCAKAQNMGWRYLYLTLGSLCLCMAIIRSCVLGTRESPKWLISRGRYAEAATILNSISEANRSDHRVNSTDFVQITEQDQQQQNYFRANLCRAALLYKGPKRLRLMLSLTFLWILIGIVYPLYTIFLSYYLQSHGVSLGNGSAYITYRDWAVSSVAGIFGPFISMVMVSTQWFRSRRSMAIMAVLCATFSGLFTMINNEAQNLAFSCMVNVWLNALYAVVYSYTPQVLATENRAFGCGILMACGRFASLAAPFIATFGDVTSSVPIWITCALYVVMGMISLGLPFETASMAT